MVAIIATNIVIEMIGITAAITIAITEADAMTEEIIAVVAIIEMIVVVEIITEADEMIEGTTVVEAVVIIETIEEAVAAADEAVMIDDDDNLMTTIKIFSHPETSGWLFFLIYIIHLEKGGNHNGLQLAEKLNSNKQ